MGEVGTSRWARAIVGALVATVAPVTLAAGRVDAAATNTVALYDMDEAAGATVLQDSSGNGIHGRIGAEVTVAQEGSIRFHRYADLPPNTPPARPEHNDSVPDDPRLDPDAGDYSVTLRYRTTKSYGNIIQKGQNHTAGGYFKFEQPKGVVTCLFKGGDGSQRAVSSVKAINDGLWHVVKCERTSAGVTMFVDGVMSMRLLGPTGTINNNKPLSIAGKAECDQLEVTCDYFPGDIDYVRIEKGAGGASNALPNAAFTTSCNMLTCTFNGSGSSDPDGEIHAYSWNFGDGGAATGPTATYSFVNPGTYNVALNVVDDAGGIDRETRSLTVSGPAHSNISFVGRVTSTGNKTRHSLTVPSTVRAGDAMILLFSQNTAATTTGPRGGVTGWTSLGTSTGGFAKSQVWRKVASSADPGKGIRIDLSAMSKASMVLLVYRGTNAANPVQTVVSNAPTVSSAQRTTPTVSVVGAGRWVVSYWMHGDSRSTSLSVPAGVTSRAALTQSGGGRVTTLTADSGGPVPGGTTYGGNTATAQSASTTASVWTIVLIPRA